MEQNENMVPQEESFEAEDLLPGATEEPQDDSLSLEDALTETGTEQTGDQQPQSAGGERKEPGYVQTRINKAVEKAVSAVRSEYEAKLAPLMEHMLNTEAQELVRSGKVKDLETAKELVRYRQGQPPQPEQPRNEKGQFTSGGEEERDSATQARIDMLQHQADKIRQKGIDVIAEFQTNEETKQKVISGEWDFYDVADMLSQRSQKRRTPAPMRSPNGASGAEKSTIASMTDEQFEKLERKIREGARYSLR